MPLGWALRFYMLRLRECWNGYGEPPPMDRDKHAEQVQAKRDALALLEGLGAEIKPLHKSPASPGEGVDQLAYGSGVSAQRNLGDAFGNPKSKKKKGPKASRKYAGY